MMWAVAAGQGVQRRRSLPPAFVLLFLVRLRALLRRGKHMHNLPLLP